MANGIGIQSSAGLLVEFCHSAGVTSPAMTLLLLRGQSVSGVERKERGAPRGAGRQITTQEKQISSISSLSGVSLKFCLRICSEQKSASRVQALRNEKYQCVALCIRKDLLKILDG